MSALGIIGAVVAAYLALVLAIGWVAYRRTDSGDVEDYFLGGRAAKTVVLFMALFGTNVTPFVLMGIPGLAYHHGVGVFGMNAAIVALGIPVSFYLIGFPAWKLAREVGAVTPAELFAKRLDSRWVGRVLFVAFTAWTLPYLVTSVLGIGLAMEVLTDGTVSLPLAAAAVLLITLLYTTLGGMRATMWTNVFQGGVFMAVIAVVFLLIAGELGGAAAATERVREQLPRLLSKGNAGPFAPGRWASWGFVISGTVIAFPHMLVRIFAAKDARALRQTCALYPAALVLLWVPAVMFGVWGAVAVPDLVGKASDSVFPMLVQMFLSPVMEGLVLASVLAAVMSSIDAQILTLASMFTRDVIGDRLSPRGQVRVGRLFVGGIALATYLAVLWHPASIFAVARLSFSGYCVLLPAMAMALWWRRFTAAGAIASVVAGSAVLVVVVATNWGAVVEPAAWAVGAAIAAGLVGTMLSARPGATAGS